MNIYKYKQLLNSEQSNAKERPGDAGPGARRRKGARRLLLRDQRLHLLWRQRGLRELDQGSADCSSPAEILDDEPEKG